MDKQSLLRSLPKTDELLKRPDLAALAEERPRRVVVDAVREAIEEARERIIAGEEPHADDESIAGSAAARVERAMNASLHRVINATGVIIHTNLGRSVLAEEALHAVVEAGGGYSTLEYDVETGQRGSRQVHVEGLIRELSGAEDALVVNNNAAAVLLTLAGLSARKEAIVSRGQLVEIGGSFRIPDVMRQSGAKMVEVGATNKTHLSDYEQAITPKTGLLLKVHSSNFRVVGFAEEVPLEKLVALGRKHEVPVYEDQGSGVLVDLRAWGLPEEPTLQSSIEAGADVVSVSGDKLLGGPQAGILVGRAEAIGRLKKHPLARAVRIDKLSLAALEATLRLYLDPALAVRSIPTLRMLALPPDEVAGRAQTIAERIEGTSGGAYRVCTCEDASRAGGGALPLADIPTTVVAVSPLAMSANDLEERLRLGEPTIVTRISEDRVVIDPRTLLPGEEEEVVGALSEIAATSGFPEALAP